MSTLTSARNSNCLAQYIYNAKCKNNIVDTVWLFYGINQREPYPNKHLPSLALYLGDYPEEYDWSLVKDKEVLAYSFSELTSQYHYRLSKKLLENGASIVRVIHVKNNHQMQIFNRLQEVVSE